MGQIILGNGAIAIVDDDMQSELSRWKWRQHKDGYAYRTIRHPANPKKWSNLYLHRFIMRPPDGFTVDHINRIKLDNRRINLRNVERFLNSHNRETRTNNSTGHRGITRQKGRNRYSVSLYIKRTFHWIGSFKTLEEAITARNSAVEAAGILQ